MCTGADEEEEDDDDVAAAAELAAIETPSPDARTDDLRADDEERAVDACTSISDASVSASSSNS